MELMNVICQYIFKRNNNSIVRGLCFICGKWIYMQKNKQWRILEQKNRGYTCKKDEEFYVLNKGTQISDLISGHLI